MATVTLWRVYAASLDNLHAKKAKNKEKKRRGRRRGWKGGWAEGSGLRERGGGGVDQGGDGRVYVYCRALQSGIPTPELSAFSSPLGSAGKPG